MTTEWMTRLKSITLNVDGEVPPRWPQNASEAYRQARLALLEAETALREQVRAVSALRAALPPGASLPEYTLTEGPIDLSADGQTTSVGLGGLFDDHDELAVYHLMFPS